MANRNLSPQELAKASTLLKSIRARLKVLAKSDPALLFAYRRKIAKELVYDERGTPTHRRMLKARKIGEQRGKCPKCRKPLPDKYAVLDRFDAMKGYTLENTRVIHADCDTKI